MKHLPDNEQQKILRKQISKERGEGPPSEQAQFAGQIIAELYRCAGCDAWWGNSERNMRETHLVLQLVEPNSTLFLWENFRGWRHSGKAHLCPGCRQEVPVPKIILRFDDEGQVQWPEVASNDSGHDLPAGNCDSPFAAYVAQSKNMEENMVAIAAREAQRKENAWGYTADLDDLREEMNAMRTAFKDVVYRFAPILPPGWRVTGDYDKWLKGQACAGFLHGEMIPDNSLLIGGQCRTVAEIEMEMDRLHRFVWDLSS